MNELKFYDILGQTKISFGEVPHYPTQDASGMPIFPEGSSITTEEFKLKYDEIEKDYSINKLRIERNILLKDCDWTQVLDVSLANKDDWMTYRQTLRDIPATSPNVITDMAGNLVNFEFPKKPI